MLSYQDHNKIYDHSDDKLWTFLINMDYSNSLLHSRNKHDSQSVHVANESACSVCLCVNE